jgi:L-rhamnose isomerase
MAGCEVAAVSGVEGAQVISLITELAAPFLPYIIGAIAIIGGLWGKAKLDRRKGARENQAKTDAANARETIKAHEERTDVEADVARGGNARDRLHADWKR